MHAMKNLIPFRLSVPQKDYERHFVRTWPAAEANARRDDGRYPGSICRAGWRPATFDPVWKSPEISIPLREGAEHCGAAWGLLHHQGGIQQLRRGA